MKNTVLTFILFSFCISSFAQSNPISTNTKGLRLKISTEFSTDLEGIFTFRNAPLIPAIQFRTEKGHLHQLEVLHLSGNLDFDSTPAKEDGFNWGFRYEFAYPILSQEVGSWMPYLGIGIMNANNSWILDTDNNMGTPPRHSMNLTDLSLVPSAQFQINDKMFIDFALSLVLFNMERRKEVSVTTVNIIDQIIEIQRETYFKFFNQMGMRFGLGFKL